MLYEQELVPHNPSAADFHLLYDFYEKWFEVVLQAKVELLFDSVYQITGNVSFKISCHGKKKRHGLDFTRYEC